MIAESGGKSMFERVGHAFIKRRMADENGLFAGEITAIIISVILIILIQA